MYNTKETCLGECHTVIIFEKSIYDEMMEMLLKLYNFEQNMPQTGLITTTKLAGHRLVITAYNSKKIVVQGNSFPIWKSTVFRTLSEKLDQTLADITQKSSGSTAAASKPINTIPSSKPKSKQHPCSVH